MEFFGDDAMGRKAAKQGLLQLSERSDPIIRQKCLHIFAATPDYLDDWRDKDVSVQVEFMMQQDEERGIRKEAEAVMEKWRDQGGG